MANTYQIYTEEGKRNALITADGLSATENATLVVDYEDGGSTIKAILPKNWAVVEVQ